MIKKTIKKQNIFLLNKNYNKPLKTSLKPYEHYRFHHFHFFINFSGNETHFHLKQAFLTRGGNGTKPVKSTKLSLFPRFQWKPLPNRWQRQCFPSVAAFPLSIYNIYFSLGGNEKISLNKNQLKNKSRSRS